MNQNNKQYKNKRMSIAHWAEEDQPREKMLIEGKTSLSNAELLGIILGSGSRNLSAIDVAKHILQSIDHNIAQLSTLSIQDLLKFKGIGPAKAVNIMAALELGKRAGNSSKPIQKQITCSFDSYGFLKDFLSDLKHEEFWILLLSRANRVISKHRIAVGGVSATFADPKIIFSKALEKLASSIILAHNHPSGNLSPSVQDIELTKKLVQAGKHLDIKVLDHLIISDQGYYSFTDEGLIS